MGHCISIFLRIKAFWRRLLDLLAVSRTIEKDWRATAVPVVRADRTKHMRTEFLHNDFGFLLTLSLGEGTLWSRFQQWGPLSWGFKAEWWRGAWGPGPAAAPPFGRLPQTNLEWQAWSSCWHPSPRQAGWAYSSQDRVYLDAPIHQSNKWMTLGRRWAN